MRRNNVPRCSRVMGHLEWKLASVSQLLWVHMAVAHLGDIQTTESLGCNHCISEITQSFIQCTDEESFMGHSLCFFTSLYLSLLVHEMIMVTVIESSWVLMNCCYQVFRRVQSQPEEIGQRVKVLVFQAWKPEFEPWDPHIAGRSEKVVPLTFTCTCWHVGTPHTHTKIHKE